MHCNKRSPHAATKTQSSQKKSLKCAFPQSNSLKTVNAKSLWLKLIFLAFLKADFSYQISSSTKHEATEFLIPRSNSTYNFCEIYLFISGFISKKCQGSLQRQGLDGKKKFLSDEIVDKGK